MESIELMDGSSIRCETLTKQEYEHMKSTAIGSVPRYLEGYEVDVYELSDGRVIVGSDGYFTLYLSLSDFDKVLNDAAANSGGREVMLNKNPYKEKFPENTSALISTLLSKLDIKAEKIDYALLSVVDNRLIYIDHKEIFCKEYFINLIALVGEALRRELAVTWQMELADDRQTWNPSISANRHKIDFFVYLYEDIFLQKAQDNNLLSELYLTVSDIIINRSSSYP